MKLLCPWCLGELPGKPGQVAKCRHCASDIHWGGKTPFKTAEEARAALQQSALDELKAAIDKRDIQTEQAASVVPVKSVDTPAEVSVPRASNRIRLASLIEWWNDWRVRWREYREDRAYRKKLLLEHGDPDDLAVWWLRWRWYVLLAPIWTIRSVRARNPVVSRSSETTGTRSSGMVASCMGPPGNASPHPRLHKAIIWRKDRT